MPLLSPRRPSQAPLGLDLQPDAARLVALGRTSRGQLVLEHCACEPMAPACLVDGRVDNFDALTQTVSRLLRRSGVRAVHVAMALPEAAVIVRRITLPQMLAAEELQTRVRSEAERLIPVPLQEVYLDYAVLEPRAALAAQDGSAHTPWPVRRVQDADPMDLLLVAARRERVRELQALAEAVGLKAVAVDVAAFAARRAVRHLMARSMSRPAGAGADGLADPRPRAEPIVALLDLRADRVDWQLLRGDELIHANQHLRHDLGGVSTQDHAGAGLEWAQALAPALSQASMAAGPLDALWLMGAVDHCADLAQALSDLLACPCRVANPFEGMVHRRPPAWRITRARRAWDAQGAQGVTAPQESAASAYLQACGLALRGFQP